jgi:hypothetical protein
MKETKSFKKTAFSTKSNGKKKSLMTRKNKIKI